MQGIRVLDLTRVLAGPWATMQLADQGAQVIKVEPPGGDETRGFGPVIRGESTYFQSANRNKRSIVLDLRTEAGREVLDRLIDEADVLMQNFRPGVAERLGFSWDRVHARNPRLVYVAIHAFGDSGGPELTKRPGYDIVLQAMGGSASISGFPDRPPSKSGTSSADLTAGLLAVQGVLFGLLNRERTGVGEKVVVNMLHAQASTLAYHATRWSIAGIVEQRRGNSHAGLVPYDFFPCADGYLAVGCGNDAIWQRLRSGLGIEDRPEWRKNTDRVADRAAVDGEVASRLQGWTMAEADERLTAAGVPVGPVQSVDQALTHPGVSLLELDHPVLGPMKIPGPLIQTSTTIQQHTRPPLLAEHRDAILSELGFSDVDVQALESGGAFGVAESGEA